MIELQPHPARVRNIVTKELVEAFPDMRQIMIDGVRVGYCTMLPGYPICLIVRLKDCEEQSVREFVEAQLGASVSRVAKAPEMIDTQEDDE